MTTLKIHNCNKPEATKEKWQAEEVWECSFCQKRYRISRNLEYYGFLSWRSRSVYEWVSYYGPVEEVNDAN